MDNHDHKWCYVNPKSQAYREDVRVRRIQAAKKKGVQLPDYLQEERPARAHSLVGKLDMDQALTEDLVGALRLVGSMGEDEVQQTVDTIIDAHQQREGLVATIHHTSDGTCPTCVYSLGAGDGGRIAPPVRPSTWDRLMEGYV